MLVCPVDLGLPEMRASRIMTTGGNSRENKKVFRGADISDSPGVDTGRQLVDVAGRHGVSPATIHHYWKSKSKYSGMTLSELRRLKTLEEENARLKRIE